MKNKKLFGKLNIVDIVIILVLIAAAAFFAVRYLNVGDLVNAETVEIKYTVVIDAMPEELFNEAVKTLPAAMISSEKDVEIVNGTILSASAVPVTVASYTSNDPYNVKTLFTIIPSSDEKFVKATFECVATVNAAMPQNKAGTQELRIGRNHILKSRNIELVGIITKIVIGDEN